MVSAQKEEVLWIFDFVGQQEANGLQTLFSSVNVVAEEQVVRLGRETTIFKEAQQIKVLAMNITTNLNRCFQFEENGLAGEDFAGPLAEAADFQLGELDVFAGTTSFNLKETFNDIVDVEIRGHGVFTRRRFD